MEINLLHQKNKSEKGLEKNSQLLKLSVDELSEVVGGGDSVKKRYTVLLNNNCVRCKDNDTGSDANNGG